MSIVMVDIVSHGNIETLEFVDCFIDTHEHILEAQNGSDEIFLFHG